MNYLDKARFFEDLGYRPHEGQWAVHNSKASRRVVACGVRWGKSRCAAMEALAAAMEPRKLSRGWVVAPTLDLADKVHREIVMIAMERLRHYVIDMREAEKRLVLRNLGGGTSEIRGKTADNPVSLLGEGLDYVICDESARLRPQIWSSYLSQRLIDKAGWALLISTPRGKGWFFDAWRRGQGGDPNYESWNAPSWQNPYLKRELIEAERSRLTEAVFKQEFEAAFLEGAGQVFRQVRESATGEWQQPVKSQTYFAGLDLARVEDYTVLVVVNSKREVVHLDRFQRIDWQLQASRIKATLDRYNKATVLMDSTGVGDPLQENLTAIGCYVEGYKFTQQSKSALINNLQLMLEKRWLVLPRPELCPELIDELEGFEYSITDLGNVKTGAVGGMDDDCVIGLALAAWKVRRDEAPMKPVWIGGGRRRW